MELSGVPLRAATHRQRQEGYFSALAFSAIGEKMEAVGDLILRFS
jgi:hypothetical protein